MMNVMKHQASKFYEQIRQMEKAIMPVYDIQCDVCKKESFIFRSIATRDEYLPICCNQSMHRKISAPYVTDDITPYKSQITGEMIESRSQHRNHLKDNNCTEVGNETKYLSKKERKIDGLKETLIDVVNSKLK